MRFSAALPWRTAIKLHKRLGRIAGALAGRRRGIVRRNVEICFPSLAEREREALVARQFENVGAMLAELAVIWFGSIDALRHRFRIEGVEHLDAALARGKGVILFSGHFTPLEICAPAVRQMVPLYAVMFRRRSNPLLDEIQRRGRVRTADVAVPNNNIRAVLRALARNATLWYAPDQARIDTGELLPFFGEPCMVSTAASRLARLSGAAIIPFFYCRTDDDSGYVLRFHAPLQGLPSADATHDTLRLMAVLEDFVRQCPDQYHWMHRKFKDRRGDLRDAYADR
jgi:Kdo2-lipid IVA lauroyltransferase/acyltransferase